MNTELLLRRVSQENNGLFFIGKAFTTKEESPYPEELLKFDDGCFVAPLSSPADYSEDCLYEYVPSKEYTDIRSVVFYAYPDFVIYFVSFAEPNDTPDMTPRPELEDDIHPASRWAARTMYELLKNMREWSFIREPFFESPYAPMAGISQLFFEKADAPVNILAEIDSWPDMHAAKYLKGDPLAYRRPSSFPTPSREMQQWLLSLQRKWSLEAARPVIEDEE